MAAATAPGASAADEDDGRAVFWWEHLDVAQLRALERMRAALDAAGLGADDDDAAAAIRALPPSLTTDLALVRFLRARAFDVDRAAAMYADMALWRLRERPGEPERGGGGGEDDEDEEGKEEDDEDAERRRRAALRRHYPSHLHKTDIHGRPVAYRLLGRADADALLRHLTPRQFLRMHVAANERFREVVLPACSRQAGRDIVAGLVVLDLEGFSLSRHFSPAVRSVVQLLSQVDSLNYPEHLGEMVIVNAPALFRSAWLAVRPFLNERSLRKISVVGPGRGAARAALAALVPTDRLPEAYGGTSRADWRPGGTGDGEDDDDDGGAGNGGGGGWWADVGPWVDEEEAKATEEQQQQDARAEREEQQQQEQEQEQQEQERRKGSSGWDGESGDDTADDDDGDVAAEMLLLLPGEEEQVKAPPRTRRRLLARLVAERAWLGGRGGGDGGGGGGGSEAEDDGGGSATTGSNSGSLGGVARLLTRRRSSAAGMAAAAAAAAAAAKQLPSADDGAPRPPLWRRTSSSWSSPTSPPSPSWVRVVLVGFALWHVRALRASAALERHGSDGGSGGLGAAALAGKLLLLRRARQRHAHADGGV